MIYLGLRYSLGFPEEFFWSFEGMARNMKSMIFDITSRIGGNPVGLCGVREVQGDGSGSV